VIVVDANVIAYLYLPTEYSKRAESLLERDPEWTAPILWRSEFRNILSGYLRRGLLSFEQVVQLQRAAEAQLFGFEYEVESVSVFELVNDSECSAYDCEYAALAQQLDVRLVTMDKQLLRAFPKRAVSLRRA
jgi:predicted nucleic acid-binding protein